MKSLIVYASTYGVTKECARSLQGKLTGDITLIDAEKEKIPSLESYDNVIIGSSVYMGQISKKLKEFCIGNKEVLLQKHIGLYLCCGLAENFDTVMTNAFPEELIKYSVAKECFGGELRIDKMKFIHKLITGMMKKATEKEGKPEPCIIPENITKFAAIMNTL